MTDAVLVHRLELRHPVELRVELLDGGTEGIRCRLGLYRGSPAHPDDLILTSGFALTVDSVRELKSALGLAVLQMTADD